MAEKSAAPEFLFRCPTCEVNCRRNGKVRGIQQYQCPKCNKKYSESPAVAAAVAALSATPGKRPKTIKGPTVIVPVLKHKAVVPSELANFKSTLKQITSGAYQKRVLAHYAPDALLTGVQSLIQQSAEGNVDASKTLMLMYKVLENKSVVSIVNNNNVDARSVSVNANNEVRGHANFIRMLAEDREKRKQIEASPLKRPVLDATFVETPSAPRED